MAQVIIVEGPDGAGKTTLARELVLKLQYGYLHNSIPDPIDKPYQYWYKRIMEAIRTNPKGLVIDRLHWSEDVYGGLFRGGSKLTDHERWQLEGWLLAHDAVVVQCMPPWTYVKQNIAALPDAKHHKVKQAAAVYQEFAAGWKTQLPITYYDYSGDDYDDPGPPILEFEDGLDWDHEGIGASDARVVLVGDRHNVCTVLTEEGKCADPMVFQGQSGNYLREALQLAGIPLTKVHITNAYTRTPYGLSPVPFRKWFDQVPGVRYIALGNNAADRLKSEELPFVKIPHPQYWKRFNHKRINEYAQLLFDAVYGASIA